jgi:hypothetical protein
MADVGFPVSMANGLPRHTALEGATVRTSSDHPIYAHPHACQFPSQLSWVSRRIIPACPASGTLSSTICIAQQ